MSVRFECIDFGTAVGFATSSASMRILHQSVGEGTRNMVDPAAKLEGRKTLR